MASSSYITPQDWGRHFHYVNYTLILSYDPEDSKQCEEIENYFKVILPTLLPCGICRGNWRGHAPTMPKAFSNREGLLQWYAAWHREKQRQLGKETDDNGRPLVEIKTAQDVLDHVLVPLSYRSSSSSFENTPPPQQQQIPTTTTTAVTSFVAGGVFVAVVIGVFLWWIAPTRG